jgi:hypothetical protein
MEPLSSVMPWELNPCKSYGLAVSIFSLCTAESDIIAQKANETTASTPARDSPVIYSQMFLSSSVLY